MHKRKLTVTLDDRKVTATTPLQVEFEGDYITKKELDGIIRAVKSKHKLIIRDYRRRSIIADYESKKNLKKKDEVVTNGTDRSGSQEPAVGTGTKPADRTEPTGSVQSSDGNTANSASGDSKVSTGKASNVGATTTSVKPTVTKPAESPKPAKAR